MIVQLLKSVKKKYKKSISPNNQVAILNCSCHTESSFDCHPTRQIFVTKKSFTGPKTCTHVYCPLHLCPHPRPPLQQPPLPPREAKSLPYLVLPSTVAVVCELDYRVDRGVWVVGEGHGTTGCIN